MKRDAICMLACSLAAMEVTIFLALTNGNVHSRSSIRAPFMPGNGKTCVSFSSSDEDTIQ